MRVFRNLSGKVGVITYRLQALAQKFLVTRPRQLLAADFNQDGVPDLIARNLNGSVVAGLNNGTGAFQTAKGILFAAPRGPLCIEDFDGDRDLDLLATGAGIEDILLLGKRSGTSYAWVNTESQGMPIGARAHYLMGVADVTGEGDPDLIAWTHLGQPSMMVNVRGQARFKLATPSRVPTLPTGVYLDAQPAAVQNRRGGDFLVLRNTSNTAIPGMRVVMRSTSGALFDVTSVRWRVRTLLRSMTVADVSSTSPGLSDIVGLDATGKIQLIRNKAGYYSSTVLVSTTAARLGSKILVADLNLDRRQDLVVIQPGSTVRVLLHHATSNDTFVEIAGPFMKASTGIVGDFNGDFRPDLVLASSTATGPVQLFTGTGTGKFLNSTAKFMPRTTAVGIVTDMAILTSKHTTDRSIVLGMQRGPDRILRATNRVFAPPTVLPVRGSTQTRRLLVADLDLDGDDDLVTSRYDSYPQLLLGQSYQFRSSRRHR